MIAPMLVQPPDEIGWSSEKTATAWGPTWRLVACVGCLAWGWRFEVTELGLMKCICGDCGGAQYMLEHVGPVPAWVFMS